MILFCFDGSKISLVTFGLHACYIHISIYFLDLLNKIRFSWCARANMINITVINQFWQEGQLLLDVYSFQHNVVEI
jgi:hypothetical protein